MKVYYYSLFFGILLFGCDKKDNRVELAQEFVNKFYVSNQYEFEEVFEYIDLDNFNNLNSKEKQSLKEYFEEAFKEYGNYIKNKSFEIKNNSEVSNEILSEYRLNDKYKNNSTYYLIVEDKILSFFIFNSKDLIISFIPDVWNSEKAINPFIFSDLK